MGLPNIHKDALVKRGWKSFFSITNDVWWFGFLCMVICRMRDKYKKEPGDVTEVIVFVVGGMMLVYWLFYLCYWVKPKWFRVSKEPKDAVCDATGAE
jgi:hypothetical protein